MKQFVGIVLAFLFSFLSLFNDAVLAEPERIELEFVKSEIDGLIMVLKEKATYSIVKVCGPENNVCVVAIEPPYRDFPNVLVFNYDFETRKWIRVFEGLCLGIQDEPSGKLDLHTVGMGIDLKLQDEALQFDSDAVKKLLEISGNNGMVVVPYQDFIHLHGPQRERRFYTIDKTNFFDLACQLIGPVYQKYPRLKCIMYDMPDLVDLQLTFEDGVYVITGITDNQQQWQVSFTGIDAENRFLLNKKVKAEKYQKPPANEYESLIQKAKSRLEQDPQTVLEILNQAKQINPRAAEVYFYSGKAYYLMGESGRAGDEFKTALELSSAAEKEKQIKLIDTLTTTFKSEKEERLFEEAYGAIEAGNSQKATRLLKQALKLNPQNVRLYYEIGYAYIELGDFDEAMFFLEKGRAINPASRYILNELKFVYAEKGDLLQLKEIIDTYVRYYGEDPGLYQELGYAYYQNQLVDLAIETLETNLKKFPQYYISYYSLGQIYYYNGDYAKAKELLTIFLNNVSPDDFRGDQELFTKYRQQAAAMIQKCGQELNE